MASNSSMTLKLKARDCAYRLKNGSPKLREKLREKCRQRMHEKRDQLFNKLRFGLEAEPINVQDTLMDIVHEELKNLTTSNDNAHLQFTNVDEPMSLEAAIELEYNIICEQEQWILEEYQKISHNEIEYLLTCADSKEVFCPLCQKTLLMEENNCVFCNICELRLNNHKLEKVRFLINESVNVHAFTCTSSPVFTLIPDDCNVNLYLICNECSTLALVC